MSIVRSDTTTPLKSDDFTTQDDIPTIYTTQDVASILKMTKQTVNRMFSRGELKGRKTGKGWIITKTSLLEYLNNG